MKRLLAFAALALALLAPQRAAAQSCPAFSQSKVLTAGQWQACFDSKQNAFNYVPLNVAGGVMTGELSTAASTTARAGLQIQPGVAPTSPVNGDIWTTTAGLFARINGTTVGPLSGSTSSSFAATSPLSVSFPGNVVTLALTGTVPIANTCPGSSGATSSTFLRGDCQWATPSGAGNVSGPGSSVANAFAIFNGATGTVIKDSSLPVLLGNTTFWVRTDGNDSNTCLTDSAGGACATWQGAYNKAAGYFWNNFTVTLKQGVAAGQSGVKTYTASSGNVLLISQGWRGGGQLSIEGDDATPSNVVLQTTSGGGADVFRFATNATFNNVTITGFKLNSTGDGVRHSATGTVYLGNLVLGNCTGVGLQVDFAGAIMYLPGGKTIDVTGTMAEVFDFDSGYIGLSSGATIIGHGQTVGAVMVGRFMGRLWSQATWSGSFNGAGYVVRNGVHLQYDSSASPLPGTAPGTPIGGGVFEDTFAQTSVIGLTQINFGNGVTQNAVSGGITWTGASSVGYSFNNQLSVITAADNAGAISSKYPSAEDGITLQPSDVDTATAIRFRNVAGVTAGSISVSTSATAFNTSSDGRMKPSEGRHAFVNARETIDAFKVYDFAWRDSSERGIGVVAQEAALVFPSMITKGDDNPELDPKDPKFKAWGADYSKIVPVLIVGLQEANKRIDALERATRQ